MSLIYNVVHPQGITINGVRHQGRVEFEEKDRDLYEEIIRIDLPFRSGKVEVRQVKLGSMVGASNIPQNRTTK